MGYLAILYIVVVLLSIGLSLAVAIALISIPSRISELTKELTNIRKEFERL